MSSNQRWVLGLTAAASLMVALDALVVSTALSTIRLDLRELGGVLGSAVLASVFARQGVYHSPRVFIDGFAQALWVGVGFSAAGCAAALLAPTRGRTAPASAASVVVAVEGASRA
jgi:hypothetical protein